MPPTRQPAPGDPSGHCPRRLIVTADDFGLALPVNEAVEEAYTHGILTAASLMVTAPAAADAVARARRLPGLGVGLHLVLVQGLPALPAAAIPDLVGPDGRFPTDPVRIGMRIFFEPAVRRQAEAEIRAQLELFRATGLPLDHVNGHHHFHQHPSLVGCLLRLAPEYGIRAVRLPVEPPLASYRAQGEGLAGRFLGWLFSAARCLGMGRRLRRTGIACNDHLFGLHESGRMTEARVARFLEELPATGVAEIYAHPASRPCPLPDGLPDSYQCVAEYRALASPVLRTRLAALGVERIPFAALGGGTP
jgi:hopanoid biosynthesis associated protein HpnK